MKHTTIFCRMGTHIILTSYLCVAPPINAMDHQHDQCPICQASLKLFENVPLPEAATMISPEASKLPLTIGTLVIVPSTEKGGYDYAILQHQSWEGALCTVHNCRTHAPDYFCDHAIRSPKLFIYITFQPQPSYESMARLFRFFLETTSAVPNKSFFCSRIISPASRLAVIGDIHGNLKTLYRIFFRLYQKKLMNESGILAPDTYLICTGDLTDRGKYGPEVWTILTLLKALNPGHVFVLRGNHETFSGACAGKFYAQMQKVVSMDYASLKTLLNDLFERLPVGLILGVAPEPRHDPYNAPYHFLMLCHGGFEPRVHLKYMFQNIVQEHKKTGSPHTFILPIDHQNPETSGLLWTDFRSNRSQDEPSCCEPSERGGLTSQYNYSAVQDFFAEHQSNHPRHPYIVDALIRGHQHLCGIGLLQNESPNPSKDWLLLSTEAPYTITPGSVYTCTAATKSVINSAPKIETHAELTFDRENHTWHISSNSFYIPPKDDCYSSSM